MKKAGPWEPGRKEEIFPQLSNYLISINHPLFTNNIKQQTALQEERRTLDEENRSRSTKEKRENAPTDL